MLNFDQSCAANVQVVEKLQWKIISFISMAIHHDSDKALKGTLVIQTRHSINDGSFENIITGSKNRKTIPLTMCTGTCIGKNRPQICSIGPGKKLQLRHVLKN